ncbi:SDR family NAD(P)-dependent oxidoreductase [Deinococcus soli (ex Cha et al. 2016)]|uniref:SDR family NAD(P)-dependent oxidoreductase n=1 Tax=Deinococcus soli (ex Cha et al. 2016) TaxID=1309411 RepID=UPI00362421E8
MKRRERGGGAGGRGRLTAAGAQALSVPGDVSVQDGVEAIFAATKAHLGPVDVLVNNAALTSDQRHFLDADEAWWDLFLRVNLKSVFLCSHRAARGMAARRRGGVILNVSSGGATRSHRGFTSYDAAKGGVEAFTRALALDMAPYGVRVNGITPGFINTYGLEGEDLAQRERTVPLGRYGTAEDLTGAAAFLASDDAAYVTGQFVWWTVGCWSSSAARTWTPSRCRASPRCPPRSETPHPSPLPWREGGADLRSSGRRTTPQGEGASAIRRMCPPRLAWYGRPDRRGCPVVCPSAHSKDLPVLRL